MAKKLEKHDNSVGVKAGNAANNLVETSSRQDDEGLSKIDCTDALARSQQGAPNSKATESMDNNKTIETNDVLNADIVKNTGDDPDADTPNGAPPEAPVLLPNGDDGRVSQPGAWGVHPTRRAGNEDDSSSIGDSYLGSGGDDEETGAATNSTVADDDENLIQAELVDDEKKIMVDAEMWDEEMALKRLRRRRTQWTIGIILLLIVLIVVISLSVTLTGRSDGSTTVSTETQTVLASSSPTLSEVPSPSPSLAPSGHPSEMPSQSPTTLIWKEVQVLDGVSPQMLPFGPTTILMGQQRFGDTIHISTIRETPLGNRTGSDYLVVGSYGHDALISNELGGQTGLTPQSPVVYLCGGNLAEVEDFCTLQTYLQPGSVARATDLSGMMFVTSRRYAFGDLYDLSNVDSFNSDTVFQQPNPILPIMFTEVVDGDIIRTNVAVTDDGSRVISTLPTAQLTTTVSRSPPDAPSMTETVTLLADDSENVYAMSLQDSTLITILGLGLDPLTSCTASFCSDPTPFPFDGFSILRDDIFLPDPLPPFEAGEGTSLFSTKGLAVNGDATIVAVSSAVEESLNFQVNVFRLADSTAGANSTIWEPMGSTIFGPSQGDYFGEALVLNTEGDFLVVGAPFGKPFNKGDGIGRVYSFVWDGDDWVPYNDPLEGPRGSLFGSSLDMSDDGSLLLVGSPGSLIHGADSGAVTIFELVGL